MNSPDTYLLFYSNYCANCKEFIQQLYKSPFFDKFKRIMIDNNPNIPKEITSVPCIIVPKIPKPLSGTEAFRWLRGMNQIFLQEKEKAVSNQPAPEAPKRPLLHQEYRRRIVVGQRHNAMIPPIRKDLLLKKPFVKLSWQYAL